MRTKSLHCETIGQLVEEIRLCRENSFNPTLAIVFSSPAFDLSELVSIFDKNEIDLIGCSTAGEIVDRQLKEESIAVLLMDMNRNFYKIQTIEFDLAEVYVKSFELGRTINNTYADPGVILMSGGIRADALQLMMGMKDGIGREIPMYGGLAGDDLQMSRTFAFSNNFISDGGTAALVINTKNIDLQGLATSGWKPIGGVNTVTKAEGNILYGINGEPALDVFMRHFGFEGEASTKKDQLLRIQTNFPLQLIKNNTDSVLRSPLVIDEENRSLILAAGVEKGDQFRFSNSPGFEVIEQTVSEFNYLKNQSPEADALILFSCIGRHGAFGPVLEEEIEGLFNYWQKPMIGFLSYGEFGNTKNGICEFHNETCSLVLLKEKY